jgi:hypothetical protein
MTVHESARRESQRGNRGEISEVPTKNAQRNEWKKTFNVEGLGWLSTFPEHSSSQQALYLSKLLKALVVMIVFVNKVSVGIS